MIINKLYYKKIEIASQIFYPLQYIYCCRYFEYNTGEKS